MAFVDNNITQCFNVTTDEYTVTNAGNAFCFWVSAGAKTITLFSLEIWYSNANGIQHQVRLVNADLNLATDVTSFIASMVRASSPPVSSGQVHVTYTTTTTSVPSTSAASIPFAAPLSGIQGNLTNVLSAGVPLIIPAGQSQGIAVYLGNTSAGKAAIRGQWDETQ